MLRLLATNNKCRVFLEKREVYQQGAHGLEADVEGSSQEQRSSSAAVLPVVPVGRPHSSSLPS